MLLIDSPPPGASSAVWSCCCGRHAANDAQAANERAAVVAVEVRAAEVGHGAAAVHVAAGDRAPLAVIVLEDRQRHPRLIAAGARRVAVPVALDDVPAVVLAAGAAGRLEVDFFEAVLADVADVEIAGGTVEAEAPRIAQPVRPDLIASRRGSDERIGRRADVRCARHRRRCAAACRAAC